MWNFLRFVFHVLSRGNWNRLENDLAYDAHLSETLLEIYWSPLYAKALLRYKRTTEVFHFPRDPLFVYISEALWRRVEINISLEASRKGGWHRLGHFPIRSIQIKKSKSLYSSIHYNFVIQFVRPRSSLSVLPSHSFQLNPYMYT